MLASVLNEGFEVVLQVLADPGKVVEDRDVERLEFLRIADSGELQQLRGVEGAPAEDDLAGLDGP